MSESRAAAMVPVVAAACRRDARFAAALTYGSVAQGLDDASSDAEFWIFGAEPEPDTSVWIRDLTGAHLVVPNEFGALVALAPGGFRCEFHLRPADAISEVGDWPARGAEVEAMVLLDRTGELTATLAALPLHAPVEAAAEVCGRFANWWLLGWNVLQRGEHERAVDALSQVRRHLLWMARLRAGRTERWLTPSRLAEQDLPADDLARLAGLDRCATPEAYARAWRLGHAWWRQLTGAVPPALVADVQDLLHAAGTAPV